MYPFNPNSAYEPAFQGDENVRIDAMDIYVKGNKIYWTNWHTGRISYRELPASSAASTASNRNRRQIDGGVTHLNVSSAGCRGDTEAGLAVCSALTSPHFLPFPDLGAEDAAGNRHRLGCREHLLDRLGAGCHRGGTDERRESQDADLGHDR